MIKTLFYNELKRLFYNPFAWILLALAQLIIAWAFFTELEAYENIQKYLIAQESSFGVTSLVIIPSLLNGLNIIMLLIPLLTMKTIAGERQAGNFNLLLSSPINALQLLSGKFFAVFSLVSLFWSMILGLVLTLHLATSIDLGKLFTLWGLGLLIISSYITAGLWLSSLNQNPIIAAIATYAVLIFLRMIGNAETEGLLHWLSISQHVEAAKIGLFNSSDVLYFILLNGFFFTAAWSKLSTLTTFTPPWSIRFTLILLLSILAASWPLLKNNNLSIDFTERQQNSLNSASIKLLQHLEKPLSMTIFISNNPILLKQINQLVMRFKRIKKDLVIQIIDPQKQPEVSRLLGISKNGEILVRYNNKQELIKTLSEDAIIKTINHLNQRNKGWILNLQGHGELSLLDNGPYGASTITKNLQARGYLIRDFNLAQLHQLPNNTDLIMIAGQSAKFTAAEQTYLDQYIEQGGNLLWLTDNDKKLSFSKFTALPDVSILPGVIVDATAAQLKLATPDNAIVSHYASHDFFQSIHQYTLFPQAAALSLKALKGWKIETSLKTGSKSWNETGHLKGTIERDPLLLEQNGPLTIGVLLQRKNKQRLQKMAVFGDSDFLRNNLLGEGDNLQLTLNLFYWLTDHVPLKEKSIQFIKDQKIQFSDSVRAIYGGFFLILLPTLLLLSGFMINQQRKQQ